MVTLSWQCGEIPRPRTKPAAKPPTLMWPQGYGDTLICMFRRLGAVPNILTMAGAVELYLGHSTVLNIAMGRKYRNPGSAGLDILS